MPRSSPAEAPPPSTDPSRDGPGANSPPDLMAVPDAQPQIEPVRSGGPNKPYEVLGQAYTPLLGDPPLVQRGLASWYGRKFHGRSTANGETYNMYAMTAAHKTMPLPSYARVRNPANGREVVVRINDRGPFHPARVIDLSYTAALKLGVLAGVAPVEIERITYQAIRTGAWRMPGSTTLTTADPTPDPTPDRLARFAQAPMAGPPPAAAPAEGRAGATTTAATTAATTTTTTAASTSAATVSAATTSAAIAPADTAPGPVTLPPETTAPASAAQRAARGFWLQLGAFAQRDGAMGFQQRVASEASWLAPLMAIFNERNLHRLQAGPYASRADAHAAAERLRAALSLVPAVVERR